jgi:hypothetical protein
MKSKLYKDEAKPDSSIWWIECQEFRVETLLDGLL